MSKDAEAIVDLAAWDTAEKAEEGAELSLLHPVTGEELGVHIRLAGRDSSAYIKAQRSLLEKRANKYRRKGPSPEDLEKDSRELAARVTLGWSGVVVEGESLPCTRENALALYTRFPWIREQADAFVHDRENYFRD